MPVNRILTDVDRRWLEEAQRNMQMLAPEMCARKFTDALVQQAFVMDYVLSNLPKGSHILSAGSWEDTAGEALKLCGYAVVDVDPAINCDIHTFYDRTWHKFDGIISTSVLEHVPDYVQFVTDCCEMLKPGGIGVFTFDYRDDWRPGQPVPPTDVRLFTHTDIAILRRVLQDNDCSLVDEPDYSAIDRWTYAGIPYSFATFVFRRNEETGLQPTHI